MKKYMCIAALIAAFFVPSVSVQAASQDECAIWLCLPTGFPSGCGDAKKAFKKRIKHFKPPLPSLPSCMISPDQENATGMPNESNLKSLNGDAAYYFPYEQCVNWTYINQGKGDFRKVCNKWETVPEKKVKNARCNYSNAHQLPFCKQIMFVEVEINGKVEGETYYFDYKGNSY